MKIFWSLMWIGSLLLAGQNLSSNHLEQQKQTMNEMRAIGTELEAYAQNHNRYPPATDLAALSNDINEDHGKTLPLKDAWGHEFLYFADGAHYWVVSCGADGKPDHKYNGTADNLFPSGSEVTADPNNDIIYGNGNFLRYPADVE